MLCINVYSLYTARRDVAQRYCQKALITSPCYYYYYYCYYYYYYYYYVKKNHVKRVIDNE